MISPGGWTTYSHRHGFRVAVMKADAVGPGPQGGVGGRQKVEEGIDALICHPRLVQTGLDLDRRSQQFVWYETDVLGLHDETGIADGRGASDRPAR